MEHQSKPLLLVFPFGLLSHYLRCLVLARHMRNYFTIKFAYSANYYNFIKNEGFDTFDYESFNEEEAIAKIKNFDFSWLNEKQVKKTFLSQVDVIKHYNASAVLGDAVPALRMAAEFTGVFHISLINGYMSKYYQESRPLPQSHPFYPYLKKLPPFVINVLTAEGEAMAFKKIHIPFKRIRKQYNLNEIKDYINEAEGDITLICDLPQLFPQYNLPSGYLSIGPLIYDHNKNGNSNTLLNCIDKDKKTIYVSMGSTGEWNKLDFLTDLYYKQYNIITSGDEKSCLRAPHIYNFNFLSAEEVLPYTDLVICHGGNGTIYQALSYGIPVLCLTAHFEQEWNAHALKKHGLGMLIEENQSVNYYQSIINEWINKTNESNFSLIRDDIAKTTTDLLKNIEDMSFKITENLAALHSSKRFFI